MLGKRLTIVAHRHIRNNLLQGRLLSQEPLVALVI